MKPQPSRWKHLFLFCLGLAAGTAFCLKWMEPDFRVNQEVFTIMGLELWYDEEKINTIMGAIDGHVQHVLRYHLVFDFAFMAGVFPGIAALCMMAAEKVKNRNWKLFLFVLALLQSVAWAFDITENYYLLTWLRERKVSSGFDVFHFVVTTKWIIALVAAFVAIIINLFHRRVWRKGVGAQLQQPAN